MSEDRTSEDRTSEDPRAPDDFPFRTAIVIDERRSRHLGWLIAVIVMLAVAVAAWFVDQQRSSPFEIVDVERVDAMTGAASASDYDARSGGSLARQSARSADDRRNRD